MKSIFIGLLVFIALTLMVLGAVYVSGLQWMPALVGFYGAMTIAYIIRVTDEADL